jgi:hypothetical protein
MMRAKDKLQLPPVGSRWQHQKHGWSAEVVAVCQDVMFPWRSVRPKKYGLYLVIFRFLDRADAPELYSTYLKQFLEEFVHGEQNGTGV